VTAAVEPPRLDTRVALNLDEAAAALGVSRDHFDRHIRPHLKTRDTGRRVLVSVKEIRRWVDEGED
jgi:predicted DNA-binding protein (UPF0251 family)